jgi:phospholipase/lecithinase/hemolysin
MRLFIVLLVILSVSGLLPAQTQPPIERIYVFGDSYSDIGRGWVDSDGPTAVAYMAQKLGLTMVPSNAHDAAEKSLDFAVSGASTGENKGRIVTNGLLGFGMKNQVAEFVARAHDGSIVFDPDNTLFFIAGGLNDSRIATEQTVANLEGEIQSLYDAGGRHFRLAVLPEAIPAFSGVAKRLNPAIRGIPAEMSSKLSGADIRLSKWGIYYDYIIQHPEKFGIKDTTDQCAGRSIFSEDVTPCANPAQYFYYHKNHPSTAVHKIVGAMLYKELAVPKEKEVVPLKEKEIAASKDGVAAPKEKTAATGSKEKPVPAHKDGAVAPSKEKAATAPMAEQ